MKNNVVISVFGLGYVGLTFATCLAYRGFQVVGYDANKKRVKIISRGQAPFYEPGLDDLLQKAIKSGTMRLTTRPKQAVFESNLTFITVGTPETPDGSANLCYLNDAIKVIGEALNGKSEWHLIAIRSTVPPGTSLEAAQHLEKISGKKCGSDFGLCFNPEFLREGTAIEDIFNPDRIIIGEWDKRSGDALEQMYRLFHGENLPPIMRTNLTNAELIKYANNAFLAMKVSFINMMANLCEKCPDADITEVAKGIGLDKRINPYFLNAGAGWGGSCWPKDLKALIHAAKQKGVDLPLIKATMEVNEKQPYRLVELAKNLLGSLEGKRIAVLGLAFKPGTDDMRNAVSIKIINELMKEKAKIVVYDPKAMENARKIFGDRIEYASSALKCIDKADCALIVTEWPEFQSLKPEDFITRMRTPCLVDGRRIYPPKKFEGKLKFAAIGHALHYTPYNRGDLKLKR